MDMVWNSKKRPDIFLESGQSTVEYILLLAVVTSLAFSIFNSDRFKSFLGPDSAFFNQMVKKIEYSYRHGQEGLEDETDYDGNHPTFYSEDEDQSRFFTGNDRSPVY